MNGKNNDSMHKQQNPLRPQISDVIKDALDGENLKIAMDFLAFLKTHKSNPAWASASAWKVSYKGKVVCYIKLHGSNAFNLDAGSWQVTPLINYEGEHDDIISDEILKQAIWDNVKYCYRCSNCRGGNKKIYGKDFEDVCHGPVTFINPDTKTLECVKKLIEIKRLEISNLKKS